MSETTDLVTAPQGAGTDEAPAASGTTGRTRRRGSGLSGMLLPELQRLAAARGISGTGRMRKGDLVAAISARQVGEGAGSAPAEAPTTRGFASILHAGLDGLTPEQVLAVPDDVPNRLGLTAAVSPLRLRGMSGMLGRIKRRVRDAAVVP